MELMPPEIRKLLPELGSGGELPASELKVPLKLFNPTGFGVWYITEFDGVDTMFGMCYITDAELGYVSLSELRSVKGFFGMGIERDTLWNTNTTLQEVITALSEGKRL